MVVNWWIVGVFFTQYQVLNIFACSCNLKTATTISPIISYDHVQMLKVE